MSETRSHGLPKVFAAVAGLLLGLALLKFGNPIVLDHLITRPTDALEVVFQSWPIAWGYAMLAGVALLALAVACWRFPRPRWLLLTPAAWLVWQFVAASQTVDPGLTHATLPHFTACVVGFYLGLLALARVQKMELFWAGVLFGFTLMLWSGFEQHFGGLEATRRFIYSQPGWEQLPPEHLKRLGSNRVFATLLYPNSLAGAILLLLPAMAATLWSMSHGLTKILRGVLVGLLGWAGIACLYWSGSKAGWLIALVLVSVALLHAPVSRWWRWGVVLILLMAGLAGFMTRFSRYFADGATSVTARFDYWQAAWTTFKQKPVFGTGPGTFSVSYLRIKPPEAEMARLTHNDYLEQACDSGFLGAVSYSVFQLGSVAVLYRRCRRNPVRFAVWLGLLGLTLQGFVEFSLYIPALGWGAFWLSGWLWGVGEPTGVTNAVDKVVRPA